MDVALKPVTRQTQGDIPRLLHLRSVPQLLVKEQPRQGYCVHPATQLVVRFTLYPCIFQKGYSHADPVFGSAILPNASTSEL